MIDYKPILVDKLNTLGLPVYYELVVDSTATTPCITFMEQSDVAHQEADNLRYSYKSFRIKLWGDSLGEMAPISIQLDELMYALGFTRTNYNELWFNEKICMIFDYRGLAYEKL